MTYHRPCLAWPGTVTSPPIHSFFFFFFLGYIYIYIYHVVFCNEFWHDSHYKISLLFLPKVSQLSQEIQCQICIELFHVLCLASWRFFHLEPSSLHTMAAYSLRSSGSFFLHFLFAKFSLLTSVFWLTVEAFWFFLRSNLCYFFVIQSSLLSLFNLFALLRWLLALY